MTSDGIRRIAFAYNPTSDAAIELRERAEGWAQVHAVEHWATPAEDLGVLHDRLPASDALVVLGGDGTFLRAARAVVDVDVPILGINVGKVGFLSKVEARDLERVLGQLAAGEFDLEPRMALQAEIVSSGGRASVERYVALNDIVVARGSLARVCRLEVSIDASHLATFVADGLVVASPTGSTGYSFSAGGPIVEPTARNLIVTPIAGYLTTLRSVVVAASVAVRSRVVDAHEALVSIDGREDVPIEVGDVVEVRAIDRPVRFIEPRGSLPFWDLVRQKVELLPS